MKWYPASMAISGAALVGLAGSVSAAGNDNATVWSHPIWKARPIPEQHLDDARFHKQDPYGLAAGAHIHTNCSIYWIDPSDDNLYCFNSMTSRAFFVRRPQYYIRQARAFLRGEGVPDDGR